jgi:hypothetical protein
MGAVQFEARRAPLLRQRLGQDEEPVQEVARCQPGRDPERQPQRDIAEEAAQARSHDEAQPERPAQHAVGGRALLARRDVGDVGVGGGEARRGHAEQGAADEQQPQRRRQRQHHEIDRQAQVRDQDHRPPAETVRQRALHRREGELHDREHGGEHAHPPCRSRDAAAGQLLDQVRQHRDDDAERQDVQEHGDENERHRRAAARVTQGGVVRIHGRAWR